MIDDWVQHGARVAILDEASVALAREQVRAEAARVGLPPTELAKLVLVVSELGHNQLVHARGGVIAITEVERDGVVGLEVIAADRGDGIADPTRALRGGPSGSGSLGAGLAGVLGLADEVDFDVRLEDGTCIRARKFASSVRRRRQLGILGRPHPGERCSGDHAAFVRTATSLVLCVADGLGHGPDAREASDAAIRCFHDNAERDGDQILEACHHALTRTRGAAMAVARIHEPAGAFTCAGVGNVSTYVCGPGESHRHEGSAFVVGIPSAARRPRVSHGSLASRDVLLMHSDGISSRATLDGRLDLLREHPIIVAHALLTEFARDDDDVLVLVAR